MNQASQGMLGGDSARLAESTAFGRNPIIEPAPTRPGPSWLREAQARSLDRYRVYTSKALGLGLDPNDVEAPTLFGGDYMGFGYGCPAAPARATWEAELGPHPGPAEATRWFLPFIDRLATGSELTLAELEAAAPPSLEMFTLRRDG